MKRAISAFTWLTATALTFAACGADDDDDSGGNAGSGNKAGTSAMNPGEGGGGGTPSATPGAGGAPPSGNVPCDASRDTTCQNETDCPFVVDGSARVAAQGCGKEDCLVSTDENCARDCILAQLDMSSDCASCYADFVKCTIGMCLADCISDPNSSDCLSCQVTSGCRPTFDECSGLEE